MQRGKEVGENQNTSSSEFNSFGGFGFRSVFPSLFGEKDPFDDPFFSRPNGSLFGTGMFRSKSPSQLDQPSKFKEPVIKELDSDDEEAPEEEEEEDDHGGSWSNRNPVVEHPEDQANEDDDHGASWSNRNPVVQHPDDQANDNGRSTNNRREVAPYTANHDRAEGTRPQTQSVSFQRVTYGGINGAYYSATTSRRTRNDGVTFEEFKQADRTTGQATHRVSRGIYDKGHSVTRKLYSDGKVDTMQALHNLNEDELAGFEQAWGDRHFHGLNDAFDLPQFSGTGSSRPGHWHGEDSSIHSDRSLMKEIHESFAFRALTWKTSLMRIILADRSYGRDARVVCFPRSHICVLVSSFLWYSRCIVRC